MSEKKEESLKFPESFSILPEYIETINDIYLLNLFIPLVDKNPIIKNLLKSKINQIKEKKISESDEYKYRKQKKNQEIIL